MRAIGLLFDQSSIAIYDNIVTAYDGIVSIWRHKVLVFVRVSLFFYFLMGHPRPILRLFLVFFKQTSIQFYNK